jgi:hypothetical protein
MERAVKKQKALKKMSWLALGCRSSRDSGGVLLTLVAKQLRLARVFLLSVSWGKNPLAAEGPVTGSSAAMGMAKSLTRGALIE